MTDPDIVFRGEIDRFLWGPDDRSGFCVFRLALDPPPNGSGGAIVVAGPSGGAHEGERVRAVGQWENRPPYGQRLKATSVEVDDHGMTDEGLSRALIGLVSGLGPIRARKVVEALGGAHKAILRLDEDDPDALVGVFVEGVSPKILDALAHAWKERRAEKGIETMLASIGLAPGLRAQLRAMYGGNAVRIVREEPYRLAREVSGIGFLRADDIALASGNVLRDSIERIDAAVVHAASVDAEEGHTVVTAPRLVSVLCNLFSTRLPPTTFAKDPNRIVVESVQRCLSRGELERVALPRINLSSGKADSIEVFALPKLADAERRIAEGFSRAMASLPSEKSRRAIDMLTSADLDAMAVKLSDEQIDAVRLALSRGLAIVTGGPGTGKSTLCRELVKAAESAGMDVLQCAPTAKAAGRLKEATGRDASTIHRMLGMKGDYASEFSYKPEFDRHNPLEADLVVVDESSMIDAVLMATLLDAIPEGCRVVLVGDKDQLPPVGAGAPFRDALSSPSIPVARLQHVHRQAQGSAIVQGAHAILRGMSPKPSAPGDRSSGCLHLVDRSDTTSAAKILVEIVATMGDELGIDPREVLVLSPMRKGPMGVDTLNKALQEALNPIALEGREDRIEVSVGRGENVRTFREGDRARQTKNDYSRGVFNGDHGRVVWVAREDKDTKKKKDDIVLAVDFGDERGEVPYARDDCNHLVLSWCSTIHSAQGGQAPAVVVALADYQRIMLERTLIYTAITRAQRACIVVGSSRALAIAARTAKDLSRRTMLGSILKGWGS